MNEASGKDRLVSPVCACVCVCVEAHPRLSEAPRLWFFLSNDGGLQFRTGPQGGVNESEGQKCYEFSQGWLRHSEAEARFSGTISSMGNRKCVK